MTYEEFMAELQKRTDTYYLKGHIQLAQAFVDGRLNKVGYDKCLNEWREIVITKLKKINDLLNTPQ